MNVAELLPPPRPPPRAAPWRVLLALLLPAAALAAGTGLQRVLEGPIPAGDATLRWLYFSCGAGVVLGLVTGLVRRRWYSWALYGAGAPWVVAGVVVAGVHVARPVRQMVADRREAACRASGRAVCTVREFRSSCEKGSAAALGQPRSKTCGAESCTSHWLYTGPFRPDSFVAPGPVLCSIVTRPDGQLARTSILEGDEVE